MQKTRSEERSNIDHKARFAAPEDCGEREFVAALLGAVECGLLGGEAHHVEMLEDILDMIMLRSEKRGWGLKLHPKLGNQQAPKRP